MRVEITSGEAVEGFSGRFRDLELDKGAERRFDSGAESAGERWGGCDERLGRGGIGKGGTGMESRSALQARRTGTAGRLTVASILMG
jgi:hypothetical protein